MQASSRSTDAADVLVVEDDPGVLRVLTELIRRDGLAVVGVRAGAGAVEAIGRYRPDVVLLDLGLPDMSGFDVLRRIRDVSDVSVVVLSGRDAESDRVLALETGADDYVVKPFLNRELLARIHVCLRRCASAASGSRSRRDVRSGSISIDAASREVTVDGRSVQVTSAEFDLLHALVGAPRQVFSRQQLLSTLGGADDPLAADGLRASLTDHIHRLRRKIGPERIVTVRGVGYRFEPC